MVPRNALPPALSNQSAIPGIPNARFWAEEWPDFNSEQFTNATEKELQENFSGIFGKPHTYLAVSGGGGDGAFGAGLLAGWTAKGTRPEFTIVTGISTGALTAPFAFLGPDFDPILKEVYTTTQTEDIIRQKDIFSAAFSDSVGTTTPLRKLIAHHINHDVIQAIANEHRRGRRLFIGTFNLDAARSVTWNIGAIAASSYQHKEKLIHDILLASASIPVAFPPVLINVEVDGKPYDEMHVDGGTGAQVFIYPGEVDHALIGKKLQVKGKTRVFVIRNGFIHPDYTAVKRRIIPIATRSITSLIMTQGVGNLYQIYTLCRRDDHDFNLAFIPSDFDEESTEIFDSVYMSKLYQFGFDLASKGDPWDKTPPYFSKEDKE